MTSPNLIIIGVHKSGTTSMFNYLLEHPEICGSAKKEIHYYTPLRYGKSTFQFREYQTYFSHCGEEKYVLEASPSYVYGKKEIAQQIRKDLSKPKVVLILRDPVERFISFYFFLKATLRLEKNVEFKNFMNESIKLSTHQDRDEVYHRAYREGLYSNYIDDWFELFGDNLKVLFLDDIKVDTQNVLLGLCAWLGIDQTPYLHKIYFETTNKTKFAKHDAIHRAAMKVNQRFEYFFKKNPYYKTKIKNIYYMLNGSRNKEAILEEEKDNLREHYQPSINKLKKSVRRPTL